MTIPGRHRRQRAIVVFQEQRRLGAVLRVRRRQFVDADGRRGAGGVAADDGAQVVTQVHHFLEAGLDRVDILGIDRWQWLLENRHLLRRAVRNAVGIHGREGESAAVAAVGISAQFAEIIGRNSLSFADKGGFLGAIPS